MVNFSLALLVLSVRFNKSHQSARDCWVVQPDHKLTKKSENMSDIRKRRHHIQYAVSRVEKFLSLFISLSSASLRNLFPLSLAQRPPPPPKPHSHSDSRSIYQWVSLERSPPISLPLGRSLSSLTLFLSPFKLNVCICIVFHSTPGLNRAYHWMNSYRFFSCAQTVHRAWATCIALPSTYKHAAAEDRAQDIIE